METPISRLINAFERAIEGMSSTPDNIVRNTTIECMELSKVFLYYEEKAIEQAFTDGEQNVCDRDRDEHYFEYEGGKDYFNKNYKTNNYGKV